MIRSMTAYARNEFKQQNWIASWELRSVNQRYLETYIRLPEQFRNLESVIRERLRAKLTRGKVECQLRFNLDASQVTELQFNQSLAHQLVKTAQCLQQEYQLAEINPIDILRWPSVMLVSEHNTDELAIILLTELGNVIDEFISVREKEGAAIKLLIERRLDTVLEQIVKVRALMPEVLEWQRTKLINRFDELNLQLEQDRLEQELILLAQKIDVAEELDRLEVHVKETYQILRKPEAIGRRLDFMMQEFNREANTLASKSINNVVTACAVELKVLIEQMREQIQNIE